MSRVDSPGVPLVRQLLVTLLAIVLACACWVEQVLSSNEVHPSTNLQQSNSVSAQALICLTTVLLGLDCLIAAVTMLLSLDWCNAHSNMHQHNTAHRLAALADLHQLNRYHVCSLLSHFTPLCVVPELQMLQALQCFAHALLCACKHLGFGVRYCSSTRCFTS